MNSKTSESILISIDADLHSALALIDNLRVIGYQSTFEFYGLQVKCIDTGVIYSTSDLNVDEVFKVGQFADGLEEYVIYTIRSRHGDMLGILSAYPVLSQDAKHR